MTGLLAGPIRVATYFPVVTQADVFAHEFPIFGDFRIDLIVGDSKRHRYVLVEFESGAPDSILRRKGRKATSDWSPRFKSAFSQLVDWTHSRDGLRGTPQFEHAFGDRGASFHGLIVLGKGASHAKSEKARLQWHLDHVLIDSNKINVVISEELRLDMDSWLSNHYFV